MLRKYSILLLLLLCPLFAVSQHYSKRKPPNLKGKIEVITMKNDRQENKGDYHYAPCDTWHINKKAVYYIFRHADRIGTLDLHDLYNTYPCYETGKVKIDKKIYRYSINGGSWFTLSTRDTTYFFGCLSHSSTNRYFISDVE